MPAKSQSVTISVTLDAKVERKLKASAKKSHRSLSEVTAAAIEDYLEAEAWELESIKHGIEQADRGEVIEHERVTAWVRSWGTGSELERPK
jgi:predicted transcriptional regulator